MSERQSAYYITHDDHDPPPPPPRDLALRALLRAIEQRLMNAHLDGVIAESGKTTAFDHDEARSWAETLMAPFQARLDAILKGDTR